MSQLYIAGFVKWFKAAGNITQENQTITIGFSIIQVCNYKSYRASPVHARSIQGILQTGYLCRVLTNYI